MTDVSAYSNVASATTWVTRPADRRLRLYLLSPAVVFAARVNQASFTYPLAEVTYDTVTTGAYGDIQVGSTVLFGTAAGLDDLGRQRIRKSADATKIYIGASSQGIRDGEVDLADNAYITVLDDYRVWSKPPRIEDDGTIYKDWDLAFTGNGDEPPPVANGGPGVGLTIDGSYIATVTFDGTASFATADGATIASYLWDVQDGTITVGTAASSAITATFPAGFRWVSLTVTDSNGKTHVNRIPVMARDPDDDACVSAFEIESHTILPSGQNLKIRITEAIPGTTYPDGTLVMLWDGDPSSASDRSNMLFVGWHQTDPAQMSATREGLLADTTLECVDAAGRLAGLPIWPQELIHADTPTAWGEMSEPNIDRFMHYLLIWHTTALAVANFTWSGTGATYKFNIMGVNEGNLYDQINGRAQVMTPDYWFTCDRNGRLWVKADPLLQDSGDRTATVQANLTVADWGELRYVHQRPPRTHWLKAYAVVASYDVEPSVVVAQAPGNVPGQGASRVERNNQLVINQATFNACEGNRYARLNAFQREFAIRIADWSLARSFEPAHLTWVTLTVPQAQSAPRGLSFTDERGLPKSLDIRYEMRREGVVRTADLIWERETSGVPAVTVIEVIDADPPDDDWWPSEPPPAVEPVPVPPLPIYAGDEIVAAIDSFGYVYRTSDFQTPSGSGGPTWDRVSAYTAGTTDEAFSWVVDPFSPLYRGLGTTVNGWIACEDSIVRLTDLFGTPGYTVQHTFAETASNNLDRFRTIGASFGRYFPTESDNPWLICLSHYGNRGGHTGTWAMVSLDAGQTWSSEVQLSAHYNTETTDWEYPPLGLYLSPKTPGLAYAAAYTSTANPPAADGWVSTDWGASWTQISNPDILPVNRLAGDIHTPWPTNATEKVVYHGAMTQGATRQFRLKRIESDGSTVTDVSPADGTRSYGVNSNGFAVRTHDNNRQYVAMAGQGNDVDAVLANDEWAAFVSSDYGTSWTNIVAALAKTDPHPEHIAFAADTEQVLYLWGPESYIRYSSDFGSTVDDRSGNMAGLAGGSHLLLGIAGGEPP